MIALLDVAVRALEFLVELFQNDQEAAVPCERFVGDAEPAVRAGALGALSERSRPATFSWGLE